MQTVLMAGWLALTLFLIYKVTEDKGKIFVILILYYFITVVNDIFFMSTIELANAFGFSYQLSDMLAIVMLGTVLIDLFKNLYLKNHLTNLFLLLISVLLVASMVNGLSRYGLSAEWMGDLRTNSALLFSVFYFARFDVFQDAKKYRRFLDSVMTIILAISCTLWALDILIGFHPLLSQFNATLSDGGSTMRFVQPYEVLGIALYALLLLSKVPYNFVFGCCHIVSTSFDLDGLGVWIYRCITCYNEKYKNNKEIIPASNTFDCLLFYCIECGKWTID